MATRYPALASVSAASDPAGAAPTMTTSWEGMRQFTQRREIASIKLTVFKKRKE
jgi:hypothetical protein